MKKEIQSLVNQLNAASDAYYNGRDELMTDYEWDAAFDKLKKLELLKITQLSQMGLEKKMQFKQELGK